ncbi:hypothetical protein P873_03710 [Arenimonas composti TR7-09 = DSM 18010]|uniref:Photosynthesis system II assembly factor Ycf48/Hcf136-like domain-containing protein n=2 Tax=Arenimonas TaxID=490567 RepID=A0A091C411_9GAMM|nr:hypothetical protein P873_03710 [Arenimonas composti TR7-09 = DSM 18010]
MLAALALAAPTLAQDPIADDTGEGDYPMETDEGDEPLVDAAPAVAATDPALLDAEPMPRAADSMLLDAVRTNSGFFVVGERGHVLVSEDGRRWTQAKIPTRSTLTSIATADGILWAAGHDGVIVHSTDGGQTWTRRRAAPWTPDTFDASEGVPVLDLLFTDASHGFAVGAYSLMLVTDDGGVTWTPRGVASDEDDAPAAVAAAAEDGGDEGEDWTFDESDLMLDAESDPHFNAIARSGSGALVIAGERGAFLRSRDGGQTWESRRLPYEGSMFGVLSWDGDHIMVFGLRGNVYESTDLGDSWTRVETGTTASLMGGAALPSGGAILVGANGTLLTRANAQAPFSASTVTDGDGIPQLSAVVPAGDDGFLVVGEMGADLYRPQ